MHGGHQALPRSGHFGSLPGAGPKLAPRLLSFILHRTGQGVEAAALQSLAGTAPVTYKSGQIRKCQWRRQCDKDLRSTVHLWANLSRKECAWAQSYYEAPPN